MRPLSLTLRFIGVVQLVLGLLFVIAPQSYANIFDLAEAPGWAYWLIAMMGARFLGYAYGMFVAAREPQKHTTWIVTMIGIQAIDWVGTIYHLAAGSVTLGQVTTAAFLPVVFIILLVMFFPRERSATIQPQ